MAILASVHIDGFSDAEMELEMVLREKKNPTGRRRIDGFWGWLSATVLRPPRGIFRNLKKVIYGKLAVSTSAVDGGGNGYSDGSGGWREALARKEGMRWRIGIGKAGVGPVPSLSSLLRHLIRRNWGGGGPVGMGRALEPTR